MLSVPVFTMAGKKAGEVTLDAEILGGHVRPKLIKQAIVAFQDHQRQHSARTKSRSDVSGSTRKLYRQKGTGNARAGAIRTPVRRGGGRTFAKRTARAFKAFPKNMRRLARNSAILAKIKAEDVLIVDSLTFPKIHTKTFQSMLKALDADRGCVLALNEADRSAYMSGRNIPKTEVRLLEDLNAYEVLRRRKLIFTKPAFERLVADPVRLRALGAEG